MALALGLSLALSSSRMAGAILVQPHNYLLDDSALTSQHESAGSLSPFLTDAQAGGEQAADRDIASIIGDSWARLRLARMLDQQAQHEQPAGQLSQEMAELLESEQQAKREAAGEPQPAAGSLSSSMASMLLNVAQAAAASAADEQAAEAAAAAAAGAGAAGSPAGEQVAQARPIMELDTSQAQGVAASAAPTKSDLKTAGPIQWYNPKETIPVLKISSMATPSKYKKVYFRSEKKLVDGAFHSPGAGETGEKKSSLAKALGQSASPAASVQRRSSRGSASSAPPSVLQDGVIDFLKKFRDVYVQTRPAGAQSASSSPVAGPIQFASSVMSAAASSPLASFLAPAASSNSARPNLMGALSTASQMVSGGAAMLSQPSASSASGGGGSSAPGSGSGSSAASASAAATTTGAANNANKAPLSAQSYVSFWSKTFPTWVRKMLKQMRRRSLYNSSKRQQQQQHHHHSHHHHHAAAGVSQKNAAVAASLAENAAAGGGGASGSS